MKKFSLFLLILVLFTAFTIFAIEKTDPLNVRAMQLTTAFNDDNGQLTMTWEPLPYPCYYKVETYAKTTGLAAPEQLRLIDSGYTTNSSFTVSKTAIANVYRVTAYGISGALTEPSAPIDNPIHSKNYPSIISHYTADNPASLMPFLIWHSIPNAVCYELELLSDKPSDDSANAPSKTLQLAITNQIFTNGYQADLKKYADRECIYWRVRALDIHHRPLTDFSPAEPLYLNADLPLPNKPLLNNFDQMPHFQMPVYPVYQWIPLHDAKNYEVELLIKPPVAENDTLPSAERVWQKTVTNAAACYDEYARPYAGDYYWRVRAVDSNNNTIGTWSDTDHFVMPTLPERVPVAVLGDSITHGGGAVSNSPAALEYSYTTYLDFPCLNLGRSGDTSHMTLERFDQDVLPLRPINLLILTGSNSLRSPSFSADMVIADLTQIRDKCLKNDIRPIFLTLMPVNPTNIKFAFQTGTDPLWSAKMKKINNWIRQQDYVIDLEPYFYDETHKFMPDNYSIDGLHPDVIGKMLMGEIINLHQKVLLH